MFPEPGQAIGSRNNHYLTHISYFLFLIVIRLKFHSRTFRKQFFQKVHSIFVNFTVESCDSNVERQDFKLQILQTVSAKRVDDWAHSLE